MFLKNCWYVAGWDYEVLGSGFLARTLLNEPILFYRDSRGQVVALADRCCHRGAPLSLGRREGDCVRCMYHGLKFDPSGQCVEVPGQDKMPPNLKVKSYPVVERARWIWIWMGDPAKADESLIPDTHWLSDPAWRLKPGYVHYDTDYLLIMDNLLDFSHLPFVHPTTLGGSENYAKVKPQVERTERGVRITRWLLDNPPPPFAAKLQEKPQNVDRWNINEYLLPGFMLMDSGVAPAGTGAPEGRRVDAMEFRSCQAVTPETDRSSHYFFCQPHNFAIDNPVVTETIFQDIVTAFEEDREMIHRQQKNLDLDPDFKMQPIAADAALFQFRWLLDRAIQEENQAAGTDPV